MSSNKTTKMLPIAVICLLTFLAGGYLFLSHFGIQDSEGNRKIVDFTTGKVSTISVDADLPTETLDTIAGTTLDLKDNYEGVVAKDQVQQETLNLMQEQIKAQNEANILLKQQLEAQNRRFDNLSKAIADKPTNTLNAESLKNSVLEGLKDYLPKTISESVVNNPVTQNENLTEINETIQDNITVPTGSEITLSKPKYVPVKRTIIRSFGVKLDEEGNVDQGFLNSINNGNSGFQNNKPEGTSEPLSQVPDVIIDPRFTIPTDSILNDSITVTKLVGRVPQDGDVSDPAPFKVAIGRDNLAANGFSIPGISGMIMSGFAFGDLVRKCVRTRISRATYIFEDGRILTLPNNNSSSNSGSSADNSSGGLGYLTDEFGDPCIKGRYFTNRHKQLAKGVIAGVAAGAANAFAQSQVSSQTNPASGSTTAIVDGSSSNFIFGNAIADGVGEVADIIAAEPFDSFDQIVVDAGIKAIIHIDKSLEIDNTSVLRKVVYGNKNNDHGLTD